MYNEVFMFRPLLGGEIINTLQGLEIRIGSLIIAFIFGLLTQTAQAEGLIAHWKLDEVSGDQVSDSVGGHNSLLLPGSPDDSQWTEGIINGARMFDGVDDFVWMDEYKGISGVTPAQRQPGLKRQKPAILFRGAGKNLQGRGVLTSILQLGEHAEHYS